MKNKGNIFINSFAYLSLLLLFFSECFEISDIESCRNTVINDANCFGKEMFQFLNSSSVFCSMALHSLDKHFFATVSSDSLLEVFNSTFICFPSQNFVFFSSGNVILNSISIEIKSPLNIYPSSLIESASSLLSVSLTNSTFRNAMIEETKGTFLSCEPTLSEDVKDCFFYNITRLMKKEEKEDENGNVEFCRLKRTEMKLVEKNFYGFIISGLSRKTKEEFSCFNSSFIECFREQDYSSSHSYLISSSLPSLSSASSSSFPFPSFSSHSSSNDFQNITEKDSSTRHYYVNSGSYNFSSCSFVNCVANGAATQSAGSGGAISVDKIDTCLINDSIFTDCSANGSGGGVSLRSSSKAILSYSNFSNCECHNINTAGGGASIFIISSCSAIYNCIFSNCSSEYVGGGLHVEHTTISDTTCEGSFDKGIAFDCTFEKNSALQGGGLGFQIYNNCSSLRNCFIKFNEASKYGGGFLSLVNLASSPSKSLYSYIFFINNTCRGGGDVRIDDVSNIFTSCPFSDSYSLKTGKNRCQVYANKTFMYLDEWIPMWPIVVSSDGDNSADCGLPEGKECLTLELAVDQGAKGVINEISFVDGTIFEELESNIDARMYEIIGKDMDTCIIKVKTDSFAGDEVFYVSNGKLLQNNYSVCVSNTFNKPVWKMDGNGELNFSNMYVYPDGSEKITYAIMQVSDGKLILNNSKFNDFHYSEFGLFGSAQSSSYSIANSSFNGISRDEGNGAVISTSSDINKEFEINNVVFDCCSSSNGKGGAMYLRILESSSITFIDCSCIDCSAVEGNNYFIICSNLFYAATLLSSCETLLNSSTNLKDAKGSVDDSYPEILPLVLFLRTLPSSLEISQDGYDTSICGYSDYRCNTLNRVFENQGSNFIKAKIYGVAELNTNFSLSTKNNEIEGMEEGSSISVVDGSFETNSDSVFINLFFSIHSLSSSLFTCIVNDLMVKDSVFNCSLSSDYSLFDIKKGNLSLYNVTVDSLSSDIDSNNRNSYAMFTKKHSNSESEGKINVNNPLIVIENGGSGEFSLFKVKNIISDSVDKGLVINSCIGDGDSLKILNCEIDNCKCSEENGGAVYVNLLDVSSILEMKNFQYNSDEGKGCSTYIKCNSIYSVPSIDKFEGTIEGVYNKKDLSKIFVEIEGSSLYASILHFLFSPSDDEEEDSVYVSNSNSLNFDHCGWIDLPCLSLDYLLLSAGERIKKLYIKDGCNVNKRFVLDSYTVCSSSNEKVDLRFFSSADFEYKDAIVNNDALIFSLVKFLLNFSSDLDEIPTSIISSSSSLTLESCVFASETGCTIDFTLISITNGNLIISDVDLRSLSLSSSSSYSPFSFSLDNSSSSFSLKKLNCSSMSLTDNPLILLSSFSFSSSSVSSSELRGSNDYATPLINFDSCTFSDIVSTSSLPPSSSSSLPTLLSSSSFLSFLSYNLSLYNTSFKSCKNIKSEEGGVIHMTLNKECSCRLSSVDASDCSCNVDSGKGGFMFIDCVDPSLPSPPSPLPAMDMSFSFLSFSGNNAKEGRDIFIRLYSAEEQLKDVVMKVEETDSDKNNSIIGENSIGEGDDTVDILDLVQFYSSVLVYVSSVSPLSSSTNMCGYETQPCLSVDIGLYHILPDLFSYIVVMDETEVRESVTLSSITIVSIPKEKKRSLVLLNSVINKKDVSEGEDIEKEESIFNIEGRVSVENITFSFSSLFSSVHRYLFCCPSHSLLKLIDVCFVSSEQKSFQLNCSLFYSYISSLTYLSSSSYSTSSASDFCQIYLNNVSVNNIYSSNSLLLINEGCNMEIVNTNFSNISTISSPLLKMNKRSEEDSGNINSVIDVTNSYFSNISSSSSSIYPNILSFSSSSSSSSTQIKIRNTHFTFSCSFSSTSSSSSSEGKLALFSNIPNVSLAYCSFSCEEKEIEERVNNVEGNEEKKVNNEEVEDICKWEKSSILFEGGNGMFEECSFLNITKGALSVEKGGNVRMTFCEYDNNK